MAVVHGAIFNYFIPWTKSSLRGATRRDAAVGIACLNLLVSSFFENLFSDGGIPEKFNKSEIANIEPVP